MFRKLFALEVAALASSEETRTRSENRETDILGTVREAFSPRSGDYGSMWSMRSIG